MPVYLPQYSARIADSHNAGRQIFCNNTSCTDNNIVADCNAGKYDSACAYPAVFSNMNGCVILICFIAKLRQNRMSGGSNSNIRAEHRIITYVNVRVINAC